MLKELGSKIYNGYKAFEPLKSRIMRCLNPPGLPFTQGAGVRPASANKPELETSFPSKACSLIVCCWHCFAWLRVGLLGGVGIQIHDTAKILYTCFWGRWSAHSDS